MAVSDSFREYVIEQLEHAARDLRWKRMFGALGFYSGDLFFAVVDDDTLYFKVDDQTRPAYEAEGMKPFMPYGPDGEVSISYYTVPIGVLESPEDLRLWVKDAVAAAARKTTARKTTPKTAASKRAVVSKRASKKTTATVLTKTKAAVKRRVTGHAAARKR